MLFQILKLAIWPKNRKFPPRVIEFTPGKVNVITGASRTGKSAIIPIIDYSFASSDCNIPIDTIRDHSEWYGVVVMTSSEQILVARRVPSGSKVSNDFVVLRGQAIGLPPFMDTATHTADDTKLLLNTVAGTPYFRLDGEVDDAYKSRLSFRDLMALVFQSQEVVANQNVLFYKTHAHEHRERLRNWFPFILGAETLETLKARQRLNQIEFALRRAKKELEEAQKVSEAWMRDMRNRLTRAAEYGLLEVEALGQATTSIQYLDLAKSIVGDIPNQVSPSYDGMSETRRQLAAAEQREMSLSSEIGLVKKRLSDITRLRASFVDYSGGISRRVERLQISKWLKTVSGENPICLLCGATDHPAATSELDKISQALEKYEQLSSRSSEVPTTFDREEFLLKSQLTDLVAESNLLAAEFDLLRSKDKEVQDRLQTQKEMHLFLGHLKATLEVFEKIADDGPLREKIVELEAEESALLLLVDVDVTQRKVLEAAVTIGKRMQHHLGSLDTERKYKLAAPRLSVPNLNIEVLSDDQNWHYLAEVGSASNWVSFHLSLMCSLQEFFLAMPASIVPSFVVFDQPSQVYFPKLKKNAVAPEDIEIPDEDVSAVQMMFSTLAASVTASNGAWQAIVLDHADKDVYGSLEGVVEVDEWRGGKKLIPEEWYMEGRLLP